MLHVVCLHVVCATVLLPTRACRVVAENSLQKCCSLICGCSCKANSVVVSWLVCPPVTRKTRVQFPAAELFPFLTRWYFSNGCDANASAPGFAKKKKLETITAAFLNGHDAEQFVFAREYTRSFAYW